jgi:hypothetical protein
MIKNLMRSLVRALPEMLRDLVGLVAVAAITFGAWQIYVPAGWIVGGGLFLTGVVLHSLADRAAPVIVEHD